jgi:hypothetical protein
MARTAVQLWITFNPSSQLIDFLGVGYSTKGVMLAPLNSLSPIYPSHTILQLALLKRKVSARAQRAGDPDVDTDELAFMVVMFKKINNKNLPPGLTVEAFSSVNPNYHVLAITVPVFDVQDPSKLLTHFIVGAALIMFDNKRGSYINCLGVVDKGTPGICICRTFHLKSTFGYCTFWCSWNRHFPPVLSPSAWFSWLQITNCCSI